METTNTRTTCSTDDPPPSSNSYNSTSSSAPAPIIRRRENVRSLRRRDGLLAFAKNVTSQNGEDGILQRLFELVLEKGEEEVGNKVQKMNPAIRHLVDVGAWDGKHLSNTYSLLVDRRAEEKDDDEEEDVASWKGILIEAGAERFQELERLYEGLERKNTTVCVHRSVSGVQKSHGSLETILNEFGPLLDLPIDFDFLCIDIDGSDYWVWSNLLECSQYRPKVVCIEFNPTIPDDLIYIPPPNDAIRHGASLAALVELAETHSYVLVETTLYNAFFVRSHLYERYLTTIVPDTSIEALHETTMGTSLYQLYDGTIKLAGCKKLLWHRIYMDEDLLQVLPKSQRHFPYAPQEQQEEDPFDTSLAVDMTPYCCNNTQESAASSQQKQCSRDLLEHLRRDGFCYVRGTGIAKRTCCDALTFSHAFLQEADESVRRSCLCRTDRARRGYSPMCTENFASLLGETGKPNDLVRKFRMGPPSTPSTNAAAAAAADDDDVDNVTTNTAATQQAPHFSSSSSLLQPNVWPCDDIWDGSVGFRSSVETYYHEACRAARAVVHALCMGLLEELDEQGEHPDLLAKSLAPLMISNDDDASNSTNDNSSSAAAAATTTTNTTTSILTLLGYRVGSRHKGKNKGPLVAAHTDVGVVTLLLFDAGTCATLQRRGPSDDSDWVDVSLPHRITDDPIFVVNVADCLSELSGGRLPSTLHRVVATGGGGSTPRNCCALFVGLDPKEQLEMPDGESMTYEEWRKRRIARAQSVHQQQQQLAAALSTYTP